jgi:hypothetical protein
MFVAIIQFVITMRENNKFALEKINLEKTVIYLTNHISDGFKNSLGVDDTNSIFAQDAGKFRILKTGKYVEYNLQNNVLLYSDNGTNLTILDPDYKVTRFFVEKILNENNILQGVRLEMSIESVKNSKNSKSIQTSYILK